MPVSVLDRPGQQLRAAERERRVDLGGPVPGHLDVGVAGDRHQEVRAVAGVQQHDRVGALPVGVAGAQLLALLGAERRRGSRSRPRGTSSRAGPRAGHRRGTRPPCRPWSRPRSGPRPGRPPTRRAESAASASGTSETGDPSPPRWRRRVGEPVAGAWVGWRVVAGRRRTRPASPGSRPGGAGAGLPGSRRRRGASTPSSRRRASCTRGCPPRDPRFPGDGQPWR